MFINLLSEKNYLFSWHSVPFPLFSIYYYSTFLFFFFSYKTSESFVRMGKGYGLLSSYALYFDLRE